MLNEAMLVAFVITADSTRRCILRTPTGIPSRWANTGIDEVDESLPSARAIGSLLVYNFGFCPDFPGVTINDPISTNPLGRSRRSFLAVY